jgi:hypothetical protein
MKSKNGSIIPVQKGEEKEEEKITRKVSIFNI